MTSNLTAAQAKALEIARRDGYVGPTDARLATVRKLEALGLVTVKGTLRTGMNRHSMRTYSRFDWVAYPTQEG
jgi:hypothetical protein